MGNLSNDSSKTAMPQPFLETGQQRLFIARLDMDQPVRGKPSLRQRWGKKVRPGHAPKDFAACSRSNAGSE